MFKYKLQINEALFNKYNIIITFKRKLINKLNVNMILLLHSKRN